MPMPPSSRRPRHASRRAQKERTLPPAPRASDLEHALAASAELPPPAEGLAFAELGLPDKLVDALARRGITEPFAIQARALPDGLAGRDVLGRAQTGSGKTLAFGLPMLTRLSSKSPRRTPGCPRGLVLVPTRELAQQVADALSPLGQMLDVKVSAVYGGAPMGRQIDGLRRGVDIVVATPGRLEDLIAQGCCSLTEVTITVLDEADHMADLGFLPAVTRLLDQTDRSGQRLLFSATLDRGVDRLVRMYLTEPALHAVPAEAPGDSATSRYVFSVSAEHKFAITSEVVAGPGRSLLFVRTKHGADRLAKQLTRAGVEAAAIHGNLAQNARQRALDRFAAGAPRVLVATDVAARGIHVDDIDLVVHFDPPADHKDYLHRSGRTARASATGSVVVLAQADQLPAVAQLHQRAHVEAITSRVRPGDETVRMVAGAGTTPRIIPPVRSTPSATAPQRQQLGHAAGARRPGRPRRGTR